MKNINANRQRVLYDWDNQTVFKDSVLGYISVPKAVTHTLIDHKIFQRLRDVAQTGMEALYPGATHNRFCHSVGVYHLGKLAFHNFQQNVKKQHRDEIYYKVAHDREDCERIWNRWRFLFETACLLHDCGHSPLSHSLEFLYDVTNENTGTDDADFLNKSVNANLIETFDKIGNFKDCFIKRNKETEVSRNEVYGAPHERMSACLIVTEGADGYKDVLWNLITDQMRYFEETVLLKPYENNYTEEEFLSDLEFMARMIIGCKYNSASTFKGKESGFEKIIFPLRNCIIGLLNGTIDADNIDYSIRDASASGYKSAQVDYERLLKSNTVALAYKHNDLALEGETFDYSVCLKHFISSPVMEADPLSMTISGSATLVLIWSGMETLGTAKQEEATDKLGLKITGSIWEDDEHSSSKQVRVIHIREESSVNLELYYGKLEIRPRNPDLKEGTQLYLYSKNLSGRLTGTIFMGNQLSSNRKEDDLQKRIQKGDLRIFPAYHKSALSVIQGALDASNFESRWIYSHHATTYFNNFLNVFLLAKYADFCVEEEYLELCRKTDDFIDFHERFKGQGDECTSYLRADETLKIAQKELSDAKKRLTSQKIQAQVEQCLNPSRDNLKPDNDKRGTIEGELPETLPALKKEGDWEIFDTLLHALIILCRPIPIAHPMPDEEKACASIERVIDAINQLNDFSADATELSVLEKNIYQKLRREITLHNDIRKYGMPTMNALLGMKDPKVVHGRNYFRTSDSDLRSMYHSLAQNATDEQKKCHRDLFYAIEQYESRNYLVPMWKSHAEFHFYMQGWENDWFQKRKVKIQNTDYSQSWIESFFNNITAPSNHDNVSMYTYFSEQETYSLTPILKEFWQSARERFKLDILVYVPQRIKHKQLSDDSTYVIWKNRVVTLKDIGLKTNPADEHSYFYLYYRLDDEAVKEGLNLNIPEFMGFLRKTLNDWIKSEKNRKDSYIGAPAEKQEKDSKTEDLQI